MELVEDHIRITVTDKLGKDRKFRIWAMVACILPLISHHEEKHYNRPFDGRPNLFAKATKSNMQKVAIFATGVKVSTKSTPSLWVLPRMTRRAYTSRRAICFVFHTIDLFATESMLL